MNYTKGSSLGDSFKSFSGLKKTLHQGTKLFSTVTNIIDRVSHHPLTSQLERAIPQIQPLIQKANMANEKLKSAGNSLEKVERKITEVESVINFH